MTNQNANMNAQQILHIIVSECKHGCTSPSQTYEYFSRHYADRVDMRDVNVISHILDFDSVREHEEQLYALTK